VSRLEVAASGDYLMRDGHDHVPLLDTVWNGFAEASADEWDDYLRFRRAQGFTGLLISLLPTLHDRSVNPCSRTPYAVRADGSLDTASPDDAYFKTAKWMAERAAAEGFTLFLVVLWSTYVEGTPASRLHPGATLKAAARADLIERVVQFADLDPVVVISGDEPFENPASVAVYREMLEAIAARDPHLLLTLHAWPDAAVPADLHARLDLTLLQSGHSSDDAAKAIELATRADSGPCRRPTINAEPCYEGHRHVGGHRRFSADEVRRVIWTSLVAGASAGIGYGAHGVWQWHRAGSRFTQAAVSGHPYNWATALRFPGATDAAFARRIWQAEALYRSRPHQVVLDRDDDGARAARVADGRLVVYLPTPRDVTIDADVARIAGWALNQRMPIEARISPRQGGTHLEQPEVAGDVVWIIEERS